MAADFYLSRGFQNFAFYGYKDSVWSDERYEGFRRRIEQAGRVGSLQAYRELNVEQSWYYDSRPICEWIASLPRPTAVFERRGRGEAGPTVKTTAGDSIPGSRHTSRNT